MSDGGRPASTANPTVVFPEPGRIALEERPVPSPGPGEVLIRSRVSLISPGTELTVLDGGDEVGEEWRKLQRYPYVAGYSNVGDVVAAGDGAGQAWLGCRVGSHTPHAAFTVCAASELRPVPPAVSDEAAALCTLAEVASNGLRRAALTWGESVAVVGLGLLGQLSARLARLAGARPIFGIDMAPERLLRLPQDDAAYVPLAGEAGALAAAVRDRRPGGALSGAAGVDLVIEASGNPGALPGAARLLRPQGRLLILSSPSGPTAYDFHDLCNRNSLTLVGAHYFSHPAPATPANPWSAARHAELFLERVAAGDLRVDELVTHRFPARQALDAYALLRGRRAATLGMVLDWR
jgi:2-desacetyl-2-hydroxyethyl bacteriochlorophyllide A dehydrogenase